MRFRIVRKNGETPKYKVQIKWFIGWSDVQHQWYDRDGSYCTETVWLDNETSALKFGLEYVKKKTTPKPKPEAEVVYDSKWPEICPL